MNLYQLTVFVWNHSDCTKGTGLSDKFCLASKDNSGSNLVYLNNRLEEAPYGIWYDLETITNMLSKINKAKVCKACGHITL